MSRFKVGDTVFTGRGAKMKQMVVAVVRKHPMLPVRQYGFEAPFDGFLSGEQSIRATRDGKDLTLAECFVDDKEDVFRVNTMASAKRQTVGEAESGLGLDNMTFFDRCRADFKPSLEMCEWIRDHAGDRLIIHVGSGQGNLVKMLKMVKCRVIGIEPNFNKQKWIGIRMLHDNTGSIDINEILEGTIESHKNFINGLGADKVLLIFARPKNYDFVRTGIKNMSRGMEALLIDKPVNAKVTGALSIWGKYAEYTEHHGESEGGEEVYSIIKD